MIYAHGRNVLVVGTFTVLALATFAVLFVVMTNRGFGSYRADLFVELDKAPGLGKGDAVLLNGVDVGDVRSLDFGRDNRVIVRTRLTRRLRLGEDPSARLVPVDLFGRMSLVLVPGRGERVLAPGDTLRGSTPTSLSSRLDALAGRADRMLSDSAISLIHETVGNAGLVAGDIAGLARGATELLEAQDVQLRQLSQTANDVAANLRDVTEPERLAETLDRLDASLRGLERLTTRSDSVAGSLLRLAEAIQAPDGSVGMLLSDDELHSRVVGALAGLEALLVDLRENPKRYINVSVF